SPPTSAHSSAICDSRLGGGLRPPSEPSPGNCCASRALATTTVEGGPRSTRALVLLAAPLAAEARNSERPTRAAQSRWAGARSSRFHTPAPQDERRLEDHDYSGP